MGPSLNGEEKDTACGECCPERDAMEVKLLNAALRRDKPIFGICRGIQFINAALLGDGSFAVNSYHHQAVKELAPAWSAMAVASDGVIEAAYMPGKRFVWAVQWHPEFSFRVDGNSRKLFHAFVQEAGEGMGSMEK